METTGMDVFPGNAQAHTGWVSQSADLPGYPRGGQGIAGLQAFEEEA